MIITNINADHHDVLLVLQYRKLLFTFETFAFKCFGYNGSGLPFYLFGMPHRLAQLLHIMAIHHISVEAEETNRLQVSNNIWARKVVVFRINTSTLVIAQ